MATIEITSRVTRRSLMNRSRDELATRVLELMEEVGRVREALERAEARAFDAAVSACTGAAYGPPSGWGADRPRGWHLPEPCSPRDASMHDNGCMDSARRIRERQNAGPARTRDADLPAVVSPCA